MVGGGEERGGGVGWGGPANGVIGEVDGFRSSDEERRELLLQFREEGVGLGLVHVQIGPSPRWSSGVAARARGARNVPHSFLSVICIVRRVISSGNSCSEFFLQ